MYVKLYKKMKTKNFEIILTESQKLKLYELAEKSGMTTEEYIIQTLNEGLEEYVKRKRLENDPVWSKIKIVDPSKSFWSKIKKFFKI